MKKGQEKFVLRVSLLAVQMALAAMASAHTAGAAEPVADPAVSAQTTPASSIDVGAGFVDRNSAKFGEYNGLNKQGAFGILNFDARGGAFGSDTDATRWRLTGRDVGLDNRSLNAEYGQQGKFRIDLGFDQLLRNRSDTYQTPYLGAGSNFLTLPGGWIVPRVPQANATAGNFRALSPVTGQGNALVGGVSTPPTPAQIATVNSIIAADVPLFQNVNLYTRRKKSDVGVTYNFSNQWEFKASFRHEDKTGFKPLNMLSLASGTASVTLPDLIDQQTDQYNASLAYTGDKAFMTFAYYGSLFKNNIPSMSWQNPFDTSKFSTMSAAPSNQFHQLLLTGGYKFTAATKLVVNASMARSTQNDAFINGPELALALPSNSLHGLVVTKAFNAKLTSRFNKDLNLSAAYKFNDRDNRTPVNTYYFYDAQEAKSGASVFNAPLGLAAGTLGSNINIYANRPYSKKTNQVNLDADYALTKQQKLQFGYEWQQIQRQCNGSWIDCADAPKVKENALHADWRSNLNEDLNARVGIVYSQRRGNYNENGWLALVPMSNVVPTGASQSVYQVLQQYGISGYGFPGPYNPLTGNLQLFFPNNSALQQGFYGSRNDIHELPGMRRFLMADRNRDKVRTSLNWQASERFSMQGGLDFNKDDYDNSIYGLKAARSWAFNGDGSYAFNDDLNANLFFTHEDQRSRSAGLSYSAGALSNAAFVGVAGNTVVAGGCFTTVAEKNANAKVDPCLAWSTNMRDKVDTLGLSAKQKGLMSGHLELSSELVFTLARTDIGVNGGTYANSPFAAAGRPVVTPAVSFIPGSDMPTVKTRTIELKLASQYLIDRDSSVRLVYMYQRLKSVDYAYDGFQYGTITSVMPTNEQAPNYKVNVVGISYQARFH